MKIEEFIEKSIGAKFLDDLFDLLVEAMSDIGFDRVLFNLLTDHLQLKKDAVHELVRNYPEHWMEHYCLSNYEVSDPVRHAAFASNQPFLWKELLEKPHLTNFQKTILLQGEESGLYGAIGIPLRDSRGAIAVVGAASSLPTFVPTPFTVSYASLLSVQFYNCYLLLMMTPFKESFVILSDKEREILIWIAKGLNKGQVAEKVRIKPNTVDYHTRNIREKFGTGKTIVAVVRALHQGLIQI